MFPHSRLSPHGENISHEEVEKAAKKFKAQKMAELRSQQFNNVEKRFSLNLKIKKLVR